MADPLSVVSAISGLLLASAKVTKEIYKFRQGFREAPDDIKQLCDNLESIQSILKQLEGALKPDASPDTVLPDGVHADLMKMIKNCSGIYERLVKLTKEHAKAGSSGWHRTRWVMVGQEEAARLGEMLVTHKLTLSITLQWTNHINLTAMKQEMKDGFENVRYDTGHIIDVMKDLCAKLDHQRAADTALPGIDHFLKSATSYTGSAVCNQFAPNFQPPPYAKLDSDSATSQARDLTSQNLSKGKGKEASTCQTLTQFGSSTLQSQSHLVPNASGTPVQEVISLVTVHQETDEIRTLVEPLTRLWRDIEHLPEPFDRVLSSLEWRSSKLSLLQSRNATQNPVHFPFECAMLCKTATEHLAIALSSFKQLGSSQAQIPFTFSTQVQTAPSVLQNLLATLMNDQMMLSYSGLEPKEGNIFDIDLAMVFLGHCRVAKEKLGYVSGMLESEATKSMRRWRNVKTVFKKEDIKYILDALHHAEDCLEMATKSYPIYSKGSERPDPSTFVLQPGRTNAVEVFEDEASG